MAVKAVIVREFFVLTFLLALVSCGIIIPQSSIEELVDRAYIDSLAERQRNLLDEDERILLDQDPEVTPGFFEGDMAGIYRENELGRVGINFERFPDRRWPNNTVHYLISHLYYPEQYRIVKTALDILDFFTCIDFKEWDGKEPDYLIIWPVKKPAGCWSYVGRLGGPQIVSLQAPDKKSSQCFAGIGRPLHEIMHALGVYHEQSRPDRDKFINVVKTNVIRGFINNFDKLATKNVSLSFEYDYNSIMHYGGNFFSVNRTRPTLVTKMKGRKIGQRINLSKLDCLKLNSLYGCLDDSDPFQKRKYETICDFLGLESTYPKKSEKTKNAENGKNKTYVDKSKIKGNVTTTPKPATPSKVKNKPVGTTMKPKPATSSQVKIKPVATTMKPKPTSKPMSTQKPNNKPNSNPKLVMTQKPKPNSKPNSKPVVTTQKPKSSSTTTTAKSINPSTTATLSPNKTPAKTTTSRSSPLPIKVSSTTSTPMNATTVDYSRFWGLNIRHTFYKK